MTESEHQVEGGAHGSLAESLGELILQLAEHFNSQPGFMWITSGFEVCPRAPGRPVRRVRSGG